MNRIAIFAHYDCNNLIQEYVVYYLKELKKVVDSIIFVSDSNISNLELKKINDYVQFSIVGQHGEYDFGSYKRGICYAFDNLPMEQYEEIILVNDSCYAPLFPFNEMFSVMSNKDIDFWGCIANKTRTMGNINHIQSYFIVFKKNIFMHPSYKNFFSNITYQKNKKDIIYKYECGMTKYFEENGFSWDVYSNISKQYEDAYLYYYKDMIKRERVPFLKRSIPLYRARLPFFFLKSFIRNNTIYNYELIEKDILKNRKQISLKILLILLYKILIKIPKIKICNLYNKR